MRDERSEHGRGGARAGVPEVESAFSSVNQASSAPTRLSAAKTRKFGASPK